MPDSSPASSLVSLDAARAAPAAYSEADAVVLAQSLAAAERPDLLREEIAAHCDDAIRLGLLHKLLLTDQKPEERLQGRVARRREAILALDHAELHFAMRARAAEDIQTRQLADALRHASRAAQSQLKQEIEDLTFRHTEEERLRASLSGVTKRRAAG